jgi:hypothetical protein
MSMRMNKSNLLLLTTFAVVLLAAIVSVSRVLELRNRLPDSTDTAIVRLYRPVPGVGMIFCSGVVVSSTKIITAAHCLAPTPFDVEAPTLEVRTASNVPLGITAQILAFDPINDLGVLYGNFTMLNKHEAISGAVEINEAFKTHKIAICGYPQAGRFTCSPLTDARNFLLGFSTLGFAYPGMSGGPVLDLTTGKVIGVASTVSNDRVLLAPLVEVWKALHVDESL